MKKLKTKVSEKREIIIKKIIVWIIILMILGIILASALGNLDAVKTL